MEFAAGEIHFIVALAFHPDASAVRFHNAFGKSQPQACAAAFEARLARGMFGEFTRLIELAEDNIL